MKYLILHIQHLRQATKITSQKPPIYVVLYLINIQYMRNSSIVYPVKMEYGSEINIFVLKMMMKSGLEKTIFEIPPWASHFQIN